MVLTVLKAYFSVTTGYIEFDTPIIQTYSVFTWVIRISLIKPCLIQASRFRDFFKIKIYFKFSSKDRYRKLSTKQILLYKQIQPNI